MPWARLDDNFHSHPKTYIAGLDGCGLFCKALSYASHYLTDGFVPEAWVTAQLPATKASRTVIDRLIEAEMFERVDGGYRIHGYLETNPSKKDVEAERVGAAERMRRVRANGSKRSPERTANVREAFGTCSDSPYPYPYLLVDEPQALTASSPKNESKRISLRVVSAPESEAA